jgi:glycerol kinase
VDSWLLWNLTGGQVHATDVTNASRTLLFNIHTLSWDEELLRLFDIPIGMMPEVRSSSEVYGHTAGKILSHRIPIAGIAGDQQAALFGQQCTEAGMVKSTYGTGCFMLMNTGSKPVLSQNNLVTTVAWQIGGETCYALEGSIFIGGAVVQWLRDGLGMIQTAPEVEALAGKAVDNGGVYLVPAFAGLGAPHWNGHARGTMVGLTRGTTAAHLARAALESIAFQTGDVLRCMEKDAGNRIGELRVDGGATANNLLMQIQADVLQADVVRPKVLETTALGAAFLAGLAVGFWKDQAQLKKQWSEEHRFEPQQQPEHAAWLKGWQRAVKACLAWTEE